MTVNFLKKFEAQLGNLRAAFFDVTFDSSYPTGGELFDHTTIAGRYFKAIAGVQMVGGNAAAAAYLHQWNSTTRKLQIFYPTGGSATPAALADPTTTVPSGAVTVTSAAAQPDLVETAGRGKELANATDASTLSIRVLVFGN